MAQTDITAGLEELRAARAQSRTLYWATGLFSVFVNLLMLTGPLYMLNVYDRVLGSRSVETLLALSVLVAFLYGMMGLLDLIRGRVMARAGRGSRTRWKAGCSRPASGPAAGPVRRGKPRADCGTSRASSA